MAYFYKEDVYNTTDNVRDLQQRIEHNFEALVRNFQGPTAPEAAQTFEGQLWYDTAEGKIKTRSATGWVEIFDVANQAAPIGDDTVTSSKIAATARRGTIVEGEAISPSSCAIKAVPVCSGYPYRGENEAQVEVDLPLGGSVNYFLSGNVYVPAASTELVMRIQMKRGLITIPAEVHFVANGSQVTEPIPDTSLSYITLTLDATSLAGWVGFKIGAGTTTGASSKAYYLAYAMAAGESL